MNSKQFIELEETYSAHNYHPLDVVIDRAEGVWVYDVDGHKYLDCLERLFGRESGALSPQNYAGGS